jgi:transcriptional regulator with XRE-family HTH domain
MSATIKLLDKVREVCSLSSDAELARRFGLKPAAVSNYRQGTRHPEPEVIADLAKALGEPGLYWALEIQAEREAKVNNRRAKVWLQWRKEIGGAAAAIALTIGLTTQPYASQEGLHAASCNQPALYIM